MIIKSKWFCPKCKRKMKACDWTEETITDKEMQLGYGDSATDHCEHCGTSFQIRDI